MVQEYKLVEECDCALRPAASFVAATGFEREGLAVFEPEGAKLVEPGFTDVEQPASLRSVDGAGVEIGEGLADELDGQAVDDLTLFISRCWPECPP